MKKKLRKTINSTSNSSDSIYKKYWYQYIFVVEPRLPHKSLPFISFFGHKSCRM